MGAYPYFYFVPYQPKIDRALQSLREREFQAGRYNPVIPFIDFPIGPGSPAPGNKHASIAAALEASDADGTRSILDIERIADDPDFGAAVPLSPDVLDTLYGTRQPTREMVQNNMDFLEEIERGQAIYFVVYASGQPAEILFAGFSYD